MTKQPLNKTTENSISLSNSQYCYLQLLGISTSTSANQIIPNHATKIY